MDQRDKVLVALTILYPNFCEMPSEHYEEALKKCFWFINGGIEDVGKKGPVLVSWEQDIQYIIAPINRITGRDIRGIDYDEKSNTGGLHWWTFLSAYTEIGDCLFAQIVRIRNLIAKGKRLDKYDQQWYNQNRHLVELKRSYTEAEDDVLKQWGVK